MHASKISLLTLTILCSALIAGASEGLAKQAIKEAERDQGICVVVGESDGKLTAALAANSRMYVQGCIKNAGGVQAARKTLVVAGVTQRSSVILREEAHLPYADDLINLLVATKLGTTGVSVEEILRVLVPSGVGLVGGAPGVEAALKKAGVTEIRKSGDLTIFEKPLNKEMDGWTQMAGGADQSYTNNDRAVAPWKELRWIADPRWGALYSSYGGLVSAGGRLYYKESRWIKGTSRWQVVARDAFNGIHLWRVTLAKATGRWSVHDDRTFCCDEQNVYVVEGKTPVAFDGVSGKKIKTFAAGLTPKTMTVSNQVLLASAKSAAAALDKTTGKVLWKRAVLTHPAADGKTAYCLSKEGMEAVALSNGSSRWKTTIEGMFQAKLLIATVMHKGQTLYLVATDKWKPQGGVFAFDAATGKQLWKTSGKFSHGVLPFEKEVWFLSRDNKNKKDNMRVTIRDARTGKEVKTYQAKGSVMSKCWRARASAEYLMYGNGWYLQRKSDTSHGHASTRSPCRLGQHPANGLSYFMPHHCDCKVSLRGFLALAPYGKRMWSAKEGSPRLFKGSGSASGGTESATDWPTWRANIGRGSARTTPLPATLKKLWSQNLGKSPLTHTTGAYGTLFTADRQSGRVFACDAASGSEKWSFVADGLVEYPPTLSKGLCLFGSGAGSVYCLNAASGKLIWRLRAAPIQKLIGDRERLGSPWPVIGSVLVLKGTAYVAVGRSTSQSGGLWHMAIDTASGAIKWRRKAGGAGDMFCSNGKMIRSAGINFDPSSGKRLLGSMKKAPGVLHCTQYLSAVSVADYIATVEPALSHKKHIELTDDRIRGDCIAFNEKTSVAGWRYTPGVPNWKKKENTNKFFLHAAGSSKWNVHDIKQHVMGIVIAGDKAYVAGRPSNYDPEARAELWIVSLAYGKKLSTVTLDGIPVYDGLSAVGDKLYVATEEGNLHCYGK